MYRSWFAPKHRNVLAPETKDGNWKASLSLKSRSRRRSRALVEKSVLPEWI